MRKLLQRFVDWFQYGPDFVRHTPPTETPVMLKPEEVVRWLEQNMDHFRFYPNPSANKYEDPFIVEFDRTEFGGSVKYIYPAVSLYDAVNRLMHDPNYRR